MIHGVDVSRWQGTVNASAIEQAGFKFLVARATIGISYLDPQYLRTRNNWNGVFGAYHVLWPKNKNPIAEANWFMGKYGEADFVVLDVELLHGLTLGQVQAQAKLWLETVENTLSVPVVVYTGSWWWKTAAGWENDYPLWEAEYTVSQPRGGIDKSQAPTGEPKFVGWNGWTFWQWTSGGKPIGVQSQSLDYNIFNGTEEEFRQFLKLEPSLEERVSKLEDEAREHGWDV